MNQISFQSVYDVQATADFNIGEQAQTPDGRTWVYVNVSTGGLAKGSVAVPTAVTAVDNVSSSTDSMGRIVYITKASAGWTVGAFIGGNVVVDDGTGKGQQGKIISNTTDTLQLAPENALATALSSVDSDITIAQTFTVVKALVTSTIQNAVGIAQVAASAGDYMWVLKQGIGSVLTGNTLVVGAGFNTGDDTTGQVVVAITAKGPYDAQNLGQAIVANSAADMLALVYVEI
jgi:hypothetical protein